MFKKWLLSYFGLVAALMLTSLWVLANPAAAADVWGSIDAAYLSCSGAPEDKCDNPPNLAFSSEGGIKVCRRASQSFNNGDHLFVGYRDLPASRAIANTSSSWKPSWAKSSYRAGCPVYSLSFGPKWAFSGVWDVKGEALMVVDSSTQSIFHVSLNGGLIRQVITASLDTEKLFRPAAFQSSDSGYYVVEDADGHLMWLDQDYAVRDQVYLDTIPDSRGYLSGAVWSWVDLGGQIVTFSDKGRDRQDKADWNAAILRFNGHKPSSFDTIQTFPLTSRTRLFARLGFPILAATRGKAYILLLEGTPGLYEVGSGLRPIKAFPSDYSQFPDLGDFSSDKIPWMYKRLEESQSVAGIYGFGGFIYVLCRRPEINGDGVIWFLSKIDPESDVIVNTVPLPVSSRNLVLIPGEKYWAVIEKGKVEGWLNQKVEAIMLLPSAFIESGKMPSAGEVSLDLGLGNDIPEHSALTTLTAAAGSFEPN